MANSTTGPGALQKQYELVFGQPWPVIPAALLVGTLNVFLFAFDRPWTASDGLRNWGDWLFHLLGIVHRPDLISPLLYSGSILNLGLLLGAFAAALLSREFGIKPAPMAELIEGGIGGVMMGGGAVLSFGCNIGGFFSALPALSLSGLTMMLGLGIGAFLADKVSIRENRWHRVGRFSTCVRVSASRRTSSSGSLGLQPLVGLLVLLALLGAAHFYRALGYAPQAAFLLFGVAFGLVLPALPFLFSASISGAVHERRQRPHPGCGPGAGAQCDRVLDSQGHGFEGFDGLGVPVLLARRPARRKPFRSRHGDRRGLRRGLYLARRRRTVEALGGGFLFRRRGFDDAAISRAHGFDSAILGSAIFMPNVIGWAGAVWGVVRVDDYLVSAIGMARAEKTRGRSPILNFT